MKLRVSIAQQMFRNRELIKALAFAVVVKEHAVSSTVPNWSLAKLHDLTGLSTITIKKRLKTLRVYGLVSETAGKNGNTITFLSLHSKNRRNNVVHNNKLPSCVKEAEQYLRAILIVLIQSRRDCIKSAWGAATDGRSLKEVKAGRRALARAGIHGQCYVENGLSYKGIARRIGISLATAVKTVAFAIKEKLLSKERHVLQLYAPKVGLFGGRIAQIFTNSFVTKNNIYIVRANTYIINNKNISMV